jgi:hypothetical protein
MAVFQEAVANAKTKYVGELARLVEDSNKNKQQMELKVPCMTPRWLLSRSKPKADWQRTNKLKP